ncbi:MAG: hypothetical protein LBQ40_04710 [Clostridiales bacterium]|jgi:hypothetical protein|nr:hypothetical protein [Clostridiales bacterium]
MALKKIAVLSEMRGCDFESDDFINIFLEIQKEGEIDCARFYNYCGGDSKLDGFIKENDFETLPPVELSNSADARIIIDCVFLAKQKSAIIVLVNVPDDEILVNYLRGRGVSVCAVKCRADNAAIWLYDRVYMLAERYFGGSAAGEYSFVSGQKAEAGLGLYDAEVDGDIAVESVAYAENLVAEIDNADVQAADVPTAAVAQASPTAQEQIDEYYRKEALERGYCAAFKPKAAADGRPYSFVRADKVDEEVIEKFRRLLAADVQEDEALSFLFNKERRELYGEYKI